MNNAKASYSKPWSKYLIFIHLVVTGCSKGIGLCYAHELAKKGMNLVLIARKVELLNKIAEEVRAKYGVQVEVIIADFGHGATIYKDIEEGLANKDIGILVNNVGVAYDRIKYFHEESEEKIWNMINVNIGAMTLMTKMILPKMEEKKKGAIINVASVAAFAPQPIVTMYSATKAYVDFFSRGLSYECSDKGITVQCVCPGKASLLGVKSSLGVITWLFPQIRVHSVTCDRHV